MNTSLEDRLRTYGQQLDSAVRVEVSGPTDPTVQGVRTDGRHGWAVALVAVIALAIGGMGTAWQLSAHRTRPTTVFVAADAKPSALTALVFPVDHGVLFVDTFGERRTIAPTGRQLGADIFVRSGEVRAIRAARVTRIGRAPEPDRGATRSIVLTDIDGTNFTYSGPIELSSRLRLGDLVNTGQSIGRISSTNPGDSSTPPHVHFEIDLRDIGSVNPFPLLSDLTGRAPSSDPSTELVRGIRVRSDVAKALRALLDAAKREGISLQGRGYTSVAAQIALRRARCGPTEYDIYLKAPSQCRPPTAIAGSSAHERGTAVDFSVNGVAITSDSKAFSWLRVHAPEYGFVGTVANEPWHWEHISPNEQDP